MRVLITGAAGLFGQWTDASVCDRTYRVSGDTCGSRHNERDCDSRFFVKLEPEIVIHAAAIADPDTCEDDSALANSVNVEGTRNVVEAAREIGAAVAFISTDSVFDGKKTSPYIETDATNPSTVYGRTKVRGEEIVRTLRVYWIFRVPVLFGFGKVKFVEKGLIKL